MRIFGHQGDKRGACFLWVHAPRHLFLPGGRWIHFLTLPSEKLTSILFEGSQMSWLKPRAVPRGRAKLPRHPSTEPLQRAPVCLEYLGPGGDPSTTQAKSTSRRDSNLFPMPAALIPADGAPYLQ